jgi:outer membrane protein OmpA-like peptidoglycan-associated protein
MAGSQNAPSTPPPLQAGTQSAAPVSPGAGSGGATRGGSAPPGPRKLKVRDLVEMAPPDADIANYFFAWKSSELTPSDKKWLDTYAEAYLAAQSPEEIHVEGWASIEGDDDFNGKLSTKRAESVRKHLIGKGVPKKRIEAIGRGPTEDFSTSDYSKNRRATLTPIPPIPPHSIEPAPAGIDIDPGPPPPPPPPPPEETLAPPAPQDVVPPRKSPSRTKVTTWKLPSTRREGYTAALAPIRRTPAMVN